eukprot:1736805-Prymnesium_polylepis.1
MQRLKLARVRVRVAGTACGHRVRAPRAGTACGHRVRVWTAHAAGDSEFGTCGACGRVRERG